MSDVIRVGMIGCDTSHCKAFTGIFHDPKAPAEHQGLRIVACYPSFSPDLESSASRVEEYKKTLSEQFGVKMVPSIEAMLDEVDAVMLESVDGRRHLAELKPVVKARKPVYIDKPFTASLTDAKEMVRLLKESQVLAFSSSSLRFDTAYAEFQAPRTATAPAETKPDVLGCDAYAPAHLEPTNPGLFWYGIHGVEILYTIMGRGCRRVQCSSNPDGELAVGVWKDGRLGSMRGIRKGPHPYGASVLTGKGIQCCPAKMDFYPGLCKAIVKFFQTGQVPVTLDETLEICAFIDAAYRSSKLGGDDVEIDLPEA